VLTAGESHGLAPCGQAALESLRQEAGYLLVGNDHDKETNPIEAGLGWTVKFDKSNFKGKDALAKLMERGVGRQLVWLDMADKTELSAGARVETLDGQPIGKVTSSSFSPTRERAVAMAYVTSEWAVKGMRVHIQDELATRSASVSVMPLYDPGDTRTRPSTAPASASRS
jgi:aminomethyltransferase